MQASLTRVDEPLHTSRYLSPKGQIHPYRHLSAARVGGGCQGHHCTVFSLYSSIDTYGTITVVYSVVYSKVAPGGTRTRDNSLESGEDPRQDSPGSRADREEPVEHPTPDARGEV